MIIRSVQNRKRIFLFITVLCTVSMLGGLFKGAQTTTTIYPTSIGVWSLFSHNSLIAIAMIILGLITMGIVSSGGIIYNFFMQGYIISSVIHSYNVGVIGRTILPHAFFELFAFFLVGVIGMDGYRYSLLLKKSLMGKQVGQTYDWKEFFVLLGTVFLLLFIAVMIESKISNF